MRRYLMQDGITEMTVNDAISLIKKQAEQLSVCGETDLFGEQVTEKDAIKSLNELARVANSYGNYFRILNESEYRPHVWHAMASNGHAICGKNGTRWTPFEVDVTCKMCLKMMAANRAAGRPIMSSKNIFGEFV